MKPVNPAARPDITQVLNEMKAMRSKAEALRPATVSGDLGVSKIDGLRPASSQVPSNDFSALLNNAIDQVNAVQKESGRLQTAFQQGDPNATLTEVVIASEKASVAFEAMTEVRNRLVNAYEDIMKMPI